MNQPLTSLPDSPGYVRAALPSWVVSIALHAALFAMFATVSWNVVRHDPEPEFMIGIVLKSQSPQGTEYRSNETSFVPRDVPATRSPAFLPDSVPAAVTQALPNAGQVELEGIGLSGLEGIGLNGTGLSTAGNLLSVPDIGIQAGLATTQFFSAQASGSKFVYVIDRSGSMSQRDRLGAAKNELIASIEKLPAETEFQVIFYNHRAAVLIEPNKLAKLHVATDHNKLLAAREMARLAAEGGTEHLAALKEALALRPEVIFFLTDADDLAVEDVRVATELNRDRAKIHTIEFGVGAEGERDNQLRELARRNGGSYRYVDSAKFDRRPSH